MFAANIITHEFTRNLLQNFHSSENFHKEYGKIQNIFFNGFSDRPCGQIIPTSFQDFQSKGLSSGSAFRAKPEPGQGILDGFLYIL